MKVFKVGVVLSLAVVFSTACHTTEEGNKNAPNANQPSNANTSQAAPVTSSNSNASAQPEPSATANKAATDSKSSSSAKVDGAALFVAQKCATCHGPDGKGKVKGAPNFTDAAWPKKESDADLTEDIKKGKPPKMPAFELKLNDGEIKALVAYLRTFSGK
jgi:cbb3-type cytochrome c oxidase subunit III